MGNLEFVVKILNLYLDALENGAEHTQLQLMHDEVKAAVVSCLDVMTNAQVVNLEKILRED